MIPDIDPFDFDAALLRRSAGDFRAFMDALAVRLELALPGRVEITRKREGLLRGDSHAARILFRGDRAHLELVRVGARLTASRAKVVRDVAISSSTLSIADWLAELRGEVRALAADAGAGVDVLHDFL